MSAWVLHPNVTKSRNRAQSFPAKPQHKQTQAKSKKKSPKKVRLPKDTSRYQETAPTSVSTRVVSLRPTIKQTSRSITVKNREMIYNGILSSIDFLVHKPIDINPGLPTFPWLSEVASSWQQYACKRFVVEWVPTVGTGTIGEVMIIPEYDVMNAEPDSEQVAVNNYGSTAKSVWSPNSMEFDVKAGMGLGPRRFIRDGNVAGDLKTYDVGKIYICTNNGGGNGTHWGKVYVSYEFELFMPQTIQPALPSSAYFPHSQVSSYFLGGNIASQTLTTTVAASVSYNTIGCLDTLRIGMPTTGGAGNTSNSQFAPPKGVYFITATSQFLIAGTATMQLYFRKNGVQVNTSESGSLLTPGVVGGSASACLSVQEILEFSGSDTFDVVAIGSGPTPSLTHSTLIWRMA